MTEPNATESNAAALQVACQKRRRHSLPTGVLDIALDADGEHAYAACLDGVYRLHRESGEARRLFQHDSYASGVVCDPARPVVISAGYDGQLIWYDVRRDTVFRRVQAHHFWSWDFAMSPDGRCVASGSGQYLAGSEKYDPAAEREPSVKVFDVTTGDLLHAFSHLPPVQAVAISPDSRYVAAGNLMGEIRVWDLDSGEQLAKWTTDAFTSWGIIKSHCYIGGIYAVQFSADGEHLFAAGMGPMRDPMAGNGRQLWQQFEWRASPVQQVDETHAGESGEGLMEALAFHPREPLFLMGGRLRGGEWNAAIFSATQGSRLQHLNTGYRLTSAQFDPTGRQLCLGGTDKQQPPKEGSYPDFGIVEIHDLVVT